jgi:hypothetical protein
MRKRVLAGAAIGAATLGATAAAYIFGIRPWHLRWGATREEASEPLPGDEFVPNARETATHAITINAPVEEVWAWLVQMGQNKGGFYSYSWLENLVGCEMHNANEIVPEFQHLHAGDEVWLHPKAPPLPVLLCEPYRTIVLGSNMKSPGTWSFHLKKLDETTTRLVVRGRGDWEPGLLHSLYHNGLFEPAHLIMERKMLLGIKERAENKRMMAKAA